MEKKLSELASYIHKKNQVNKAVSQASVGWQIHHSLLVINGICLALMRSKEADYQSKFNLLKSYVFLLKKFPRGKSKSPKEVAPPEIISEEEINKQLKNSRKLIAKLDTLPEKSHFKHAIFGVLNLKDSKKFLHIHTEHHLKIIRDILK